MKKLLSILILGVVVSSVHAQRRTNTNQTFDTSKRTVVVTSAYKPEIKPVAKINFSAATPPTDTSRPALLYNVPAQNLFFSYNPVSLKPLALSIDTTGEWENSNFIKAGIGNYRAPFLQAGLSFGDGKGSVINVHTRHLSQRGNIPFQQFGHSSADVIGIFNKGNNELRGKVGFENRSQYYYGFQPDTLNFTKADLRQRYTTLGGMVGFRNKEANDYGITYDPTLNISLFSDNRKGKETNLVLNTPVSKTFGKAFGMNLGFTADVTHFRPGSGGAIKNNLFYLTPSVLLKTPNINLNAGFIPSWDNQLFSLLPNFTAVVKLKNEKFVLQGGWIGYYQKNTYQSLSNFNPFITQPSALLNTRIREQYVGFKGSAGNHFTYNARVSNLSYNNLALFANDNVDGKTFEVIYEPKMRGLRVHGEVGYTVQEKFSLLAGATINQYAGLELNERAWGLLPLEVTGALRWQILKDLQFKSDVFFWDGAPYRDRNIGRGKLRPAIDVNAGVEFTVAPKLNLWVQFNNILNNRYQRWNQYEVLGFNVLGGIVYSFSQK